MSRNNTNHQYKRIISSGICPFPGFLAFPGILIFRQKYTGFTFGVAKVALDGSIYCELKIRGQVLENFNQGEFCGPLNFKLA